MSTWPAIVVNPPKNQKFIDKMCMKMWSNYLTFCNREDEPQDKVLMEELEKNRV